MRNFCGLGFWASGFVWLPRKELVIPIIILIPARLDCAAGSTPSEAAGNCVEHFDLNLRRRRIEGIQLGCYNRGCSTAPSISIARDHRQFAKVDVAENSQLSAVEQQNVAR